MFGDARTKECGCDRGNCFCGPVNWEQEYKKLSTKHAKLEAKYKEGYTTNWKSAIEEIDKTARKVIWDAHKEATQIIDKAYKTKGFIQALKKLGRLTGCDKRTAATAISRVVYNVVEFDNYRDFKHYVEDRLY